MEKVTFIATIFNEEASIAPFLESILSQTRLPDEVIITDGGSTDNTISNILLQISNFKKKGISFSLIQKSGNRSVGRNAAIEKAKNNIIAVSDAGCLLDKNWLKEIVVPFSHKTVDVVAGYYKGESKTIFQKCLIPYVLVMPDKVDEDSFLPATRSMAFRKEIWKKAGKFPEQYSHNEDYVFANTLVRIRANSIFTRKAIVSWIPRATFKQSFRMFYRFAFGDAEAGLYRKKVILLFIRYLIAIFIGVFLFYYPLSIAIFLCVQCLFLYAAWTVFKNYRYIDDLRAIVILPLIQFTADAAVISGTILGGLKSLWGIKKTH